ncbi:MAG: hypothetical protein ABUL65_03650, partial [Opitutus sp.]
MLTAMLALPAAPTVYAALVERFSAMVSGFALVELAMAFRTKVADDAPAGIVIETGRSPSG